MTENRSNEDIHEIRSVSFRHETDATLIDILEKYIKKQTFFLKD